MSDPMEHDLDVTLDRWMDAVAPERAPSRLLEQTFARTMSTAQHRAVPWRRIRFGAQPKAALRSLAWIVLVALLLIAVAAIALFPGGGGRLPSPSASASAPPSERPSASALVVGPPPISVAPEATIPVQGPLWMTTDGTAPWLVTAAGELIRIDPATNAIGESGQIGPAGDPYQAFSFGASAIWVTDWDTKQIFRVDRATLMVTDTITTGSAHKGVLATEDAIWVADTRDGAVLRIDPATNQVAARIPVGPTGPAGPNWLASGFSSIWVDSPNNGTITRIDPLTDTVQATIGAPQPFVACGGIVPGAEAVWVTGCSELKPLIRLDPIKNTAIATIELGGFGNYPTLVDGSPWVSVDHGAADNGQVVRIDPLTDEVDRVLAPDVAFGGGGNILVAGGSVWVSDFYNNVVLRLPLSAFGS
jgi:YVTN family beta-propeller protein